MSYFLTQLKSCFWTLTDMADKRFLFVMEADVQKVRDNVIRTHENTIKHTRWGTNVYKAWAKACKKYRVS